VRVSLDDIQSSLNELLSTAVVQLDDRVVIAVKGDLNCETQIASRMQSFGFLKRDYEVRVLDEIPRTDSGKVNYRLIMEML
jgi:acyl-CoA synthetase (AMP-forming)/AMP-acid ligase II